ncbi:MAG: hypothetical protein M0Z95_06345 [Actinomycetota bacterium]|nr:hypothetical protein [Actinomycetota bacterium]
MAERIVGHGTDAGAAGNPAPPAPPAIRRHLRRRRERAGARYAASTSPVRMSPRQTF